ITATNMTLRGTTIIKLYCSGTNDALQADGSISYGGTLELVNISGSPLALGDSFQVFNAASYSGAFASIIPSTPGAGLAWHLSDGQISVVAGQPVINSVKELAGQLVFSGSGGAASGNYYVLTTTNLASGNWTVLSTNQYDASGNFNVTNAIGAAPGQRFFKLQQ
ncbi:MAG TPA: hypothetical protein VL970_10115, partial [Candidatus Acidoferrales bacterium]|nr:hypothetical protein [Candidatus Acidoferrales bacterium]